MEEIPCSEDKRSTTSKAGDEDVSCPETEPAADVHDVQCSGLLTTATEASLVMDSSDTQQPSSNVPGNGGEPVEEDRLSEIPVDESITLPKHSEENMLIGENAEERTLDQSSFSCLPSDDKASGKAHCTGAVCGITVPVEDSVNDHEELTEKTNVNQIHERDETAGRDPSLVEDDACKGILVVGTCSDSVENRVLSSANTDETLIGTNVFVTKSSVPESFEANDVFQKHQSPAYSPDNASSDQKLDEIACGSVPNSAENPDLTHLLDSYIEVPSDSLLSSSGTLHKTLSVSVELPTDDASSSLHVLKQNQPTAVEDESIDILTSSATVANGEISVKVSSLNPITCVMTSAKHSSSCQDFPNVNSSDHARIELPSAEDNDLNLPEDTCTIKTNSAQLSLENSTLASTEAHSSETVSVKTSNEFLSSVIQFRHDSAQDFPQTLFGSSVGDQVELHVHMNVSVF